MVRNWALVIGVNQYEFLQPLKYAKRDAQLMHEFFGNEAGFERVFLFSDDSPNLGGTPTSPYHTNLLQFLQQLSEKPFLSKEDSFWFFFSGHGMHHNGRDYLMPSNGNPDDVENTAIPIDYIAECLRRCGSGNVILMLDACRNLNRKEQGIGRQTQEISRQTGIISIFACSPYEYSYEIDVLQQGAFTRALFEGLSIRGQCATVNRLNQYLKLRVPELVLQYHKNSRQIPYTVAEPSSKYHLIIVPQYATLYDISTLKRDAFQAEIDKNCELAEQLWMRVNAVSCHQDTDAIEAIKRIAQLRRGERYYVQTNLNSQTFHLQCNGRVSSSLLIEEEQYLEERLKLAVPTTLTHNLHIEQRVEYKLLESLLAAQKWKEADRETTAIMLKAATREAEGWLNVASINKFPDNTLTTINQLWLKYSNGHFGYSVQKQIWESIGGTSDTDYETWCKFCDCVGWRQNDNWLSYRDLNFTINAPQGHLPGAGLVNILTPWRGWVVSLFCCNVGFSALVSKLENCEISRISPHS